MQSRVMKWGNSQGIRLPKIVLEEMRLKSGDRVQLTVKNGALVIAAAKRRYSLKALLAGITPRNLHGEVPSGRAVGREEW